MVTDVNTFHPPLFDSSTRITNMAFCGDQYYEKIGSIQQSMHEREKIRLELERELFAYSRSDKRISQIKCAKLRGYLKEIGERETRAKMRNLQLLRDVESIEMSMKEHRLDPGPLRQHKAECLNRISRFMAARTKREEEKEEFEGDVSHRQCQDESLSHLAEGFRQPPAVIFMACQTSRGSAAEDTTTSVHSCRASHRLPNRRTRSSERLPSGLLKDSKVCGEAAADLGSHLSDDISGSNGSPDGCNLSDKYERTAAAVPSVRALAAAAGSVPCGGDDEQALSPPLTLTRPEENTSSPFNISPMWARDSPTEYTHSREVDHLWPTKEETERGQSSSMPQTESEKESRDVPGRSESVSLPSSKLSVSSESDLSISLTDSELEEEPAKGMAHLDSTTATTRVAPERSAPPGGSDSHSLHSQESSFHLEESMNRVQVERDSISPEALSERLSHEGLFHLFESIEGRLCGEHTNIYRDSSVDRRKRQEIISLCNGGAGLNDEDLEACGAVVLHELPWLSWSTARGCLLPQELVSAHRSSSTRPGDISSSLPPDAARLWDRWFKHALLLKELHVLSTERLVQLFTPPLLERHAAYSHQAKELVRTLLCWSSEECPSAEEESDSLSSCGLPSHLDDSGELQSARPAKDHRMQELQSPEEDSQDESPMERIPIRETKAYQLLKQSATQERLPSSGEEEENGLSGMNDDLEVDPGRDKRSSHQDPYPRKEKTNSKLLSAVQSKAFWGESDDSDSEIEAALRPQPFNRNVDSLDEFYD